LFDDRELWKKISAGDADAFDGWYRETAPRLRAFLRHLTGSEHVADDLMQETYTHIWRWPKGFNPERGTLRGYLYGIARKQAAGWWRGQRPTEPLQEEDPTVALIETQSVIADAFARLSPEERSLLWLREVEGQSYAELAVIFDIPIGTIRSRLFAAREALREVWHSGTHTNVSMKGGR
jgi:RNA polymerase sigma-70 factor (ECF subfamily)